MIKRLIFDIDNTLIIWKNDYKLALKETIKEFMNVSEDNLTKIVDEYDNLIESYENYYNNYSINNMVDLINDKLNANISTTFVEKWLDRLCDMSDINNDTIEVLEYLKDKYELVILTNWFKKSQVERLRNAKILHYFSEIYTGEKYIKPNPMSYKSAIGKNTIDECIMIGDNYKVDIEGAINIGMKAILIDRNDKYDFNDKYIKINNIMKLKEIL